MSSEKELQNRVADWMLKCFGAEISADKLERNDRFIEEALELVQACDYPKERALALVDYVYNRPKGYPPQEVGGVMITLAALCAPHGMNMHYCGEAEYQRIMHPEIMDKIRAKQASKPTGSALPILSTTGEAKFKTHSEDPRDIRSWDGEEIHSPTHQHVYVPDPKWKRWLKNLWRIVTFWRPAKVERMPPGFYEIKGGNIQQNPYYPPFEGESDGGFHADWNPKWDNEPDEPKS